MDHNETSVLVPSWNIEVLLLLTMMFFLNSIKKKSGNSELSENMDQVKLICGGSLCTNIHLSSDRVHNVRVVRT